jgi:hypothetical protein
MPTFTDDFERANGAPGNGWSNVQGTCTISGGSLVGAANSAAINSTAYDTARSEATIHCTAGHTSGFRAGPVVKMADGTTQGFLLIITGTARPYALAIKSSALVNAANIATAELDITLPPMYALKLIWEDGHLSGYYNGTLLVEVDSELYFQNGYSGVGVYGTTCPILDFSAVGGSAVGLAVTPNVIPNYGECSQLALEGTNTSWTSGTPGSPTFTVDHGSISAQTITDATHATITYCPGDYLGAIIFRDPSTDATAGAVVTSDTSVLPPGNCQFTPYAVEMVNQTAGESMLETLLKPTHEFTVGGATLDLETILGTVTLGTYAQVGQTPNGAPSVGLLYEIWDILNGGYEHTEEVTIQEQAINAATRAQTILDELAELRTGADFTLQDVLDLLRGTGDINHAELLTAIEAVGTIDLQPVLDAIAAARGTPAADIRQLATELGAIRTINDWSLGSVKTWVEAIDTGDVDLSPVLTAISNLSSQLTTATTNIRNDIAAMGLVLTALQLGLGTVSNTVDGILGISEDVLGIVSSLDEEPAALVAPVWPGAAGATMSDPITLAQQLNVTAAMDGVTVEVTSVDSNTLYYTYGGTKAYRHIGGIAFYNDVGHVEQWQALGFESAIYTPKTMARAAGFRLFTGRGAAGTITPWTITAP